MSLAPQTNHLCQSVIFIIGAGINSTEKSALVAEKVDDLQYVNSLLLYTVNVWFIRHMLWVNMDFDLSTQGIISMPC